MDKNYVSPLCSCIICRATFSAKGIHSHYIAAHTELGNQRVIESGKMASHSTQNSKKLERIMAYEKSPLECKQCGAAIPYDKRRNNFCSSSCSAKHNNKNRSECGWQQSEYQKSIASINSRNRVKPKTICKFSHCEICDKVIINAHKKSCSIECRRLIFKRIATNNPNFGGNKNNRAYGWYDSPTAGKVWLESSYEYKVATSLDDHNIRWVRPSYLPYTLHGKKYKYFPDFYLADFDVYLDPKNDFLIKKDQEKISAVQQNVKLFVLNKEQLDWMFIKPLIMVPVTGFEPA